jgi:HEAT repeat protein
MVEEWDRDQARAIREDVLPLVTRMPDGAAIGATFESALAGDVSTVPTLIPLMNHRNEDVAETAAQLLGHFSDPRASAALKKTLAGDPRVLIRAFALTALSRMRDPAASTLAVAALRGTDLMMKGAAINALGLIGDSRNAPALLAYLDEMASTGVLDTGACEVLGELGDLPGSTAVRDRLLAEANKKTHEFDDRMSAAYALKKMGLGQLVARLLDRSTALATKDRLITMKGMIGRSAAAQGIEVRDQSSLDAVLAKIDAPKVRNDGWGHALRARLVAVGEIHVVSDGPDGAPNTTDDMSTAESFDAYDERLFGDLF